MKKLFLIFILVNICSFSNLNYEDLPKEHWAYKSIDTLVKNGIIEEDSFEFKGDSSVKRYDFAYSLGKLLNKIDYEKANREDFYVLESLISEFSIELTKIGFDTETFNNKIDNLNKSVELLKITIDQQQKTIEELTKRIEVLEK